MERLNAFAISCYVTVLCFQPLSPCHFLFHMILTNCGMFHSSGLVWARVTINRFSLVHNILVSMPKYSDLFMAKAMWSCPVCGGYMYRKMYPIQRISNYGTMEMRVAINCRQNPWDVVWCKLSHLVQWRQLMGVCIKTLSAIIFRRVLCVLQFRTIDLTGLFSHTILKISCIDCNLWDSCLLPCRPHDGSHPHLQCLVSCRQGDDRFRSHGNPHGGDQDWARLFAKIGR